MRFYVILSVHRLIFYLFILMLSCTSLVYVNCNKYLKKLHSLGYILSDLLFIWPLYLPLYYLHIFPTTFKSIFPLITLTSST
jgi:hypothetical protein